MDKKLKYIYLENSYSIWNKHNMTCWIMEETTIKYNSPFSSDVLNRSWESMYLEWRLHNIGYWVTRPFIFIPAIKKLNERFKHLDLEELE